MSLNPRLQGMGGSERAGGCQRALTQKQTLGAAAHLSLVICVSLRMAASAEAPLSPIQFSARLRARGGGSVRAGVSMGADTKRTLWGGGALEVGDLRLLEDGGERSGALGSDAVVCETVSERQDGRW